MTHRLSNRLSKLKKMFKKKENVVITTISVPVEMAAFFKEMKEAGINRSNVIVTYFQATPEYKKFSKKYEVLESIDPRKFSTTDTDGEK